MAMTVEDEDYLFECMERIMEETHENNIMLHQICDVINFHHTRHNQENDDDFMRNVLANLLSSGIDLRGMLGSRRGR
jgi:hypothetical protein